jgi:enoyl-CoA hydratase/carnithine racemase
MSYRNILTERIETVALITLNRPEKLNAMSYELACDLDAELSKIETDSDVRAVILTGAGPRAFSSGGDIHQMVSLTAEELAARSEFRSQANWHIATFAKPIIGAINGLAYGAGALLASMLDIRIGCELTEFRFLAARFGRVNSTWSLPLVVGIPKAKELLYTGRAVTTDEAERIGLLNQVVPSAQLRDKASNTCSTKTSACLGACVTTANRAHVKARSRPITPERDSKTSWRARVCVRDALLAPISIIRQTLARNHPSARAFPGLRLVRFVQAVSTFHNALNVLPALAIIGLTSRSQSGALSQICPCQS